MAPAGVSQTGAILNLPAMVLIALTGWGQDEDRRRTREAGFDHHMVKPVDPTQLIRILAELQAVRG